MCSPGWLHKVALAGALHVCGACFRRYLSIHCLRLQRMRDRGEIIYIKSLERAKFSDVIYRRQFG